MKRFYGKKYNVERIFADDGEIVSSVTAAAPYGDKILLTGSSLSSFRSRGWMETDENGDRRCHDQAGRRLYFTSWYHLGAYRGEN
jgi:hypothetical protein